MVSMTRWIFCCFLHAICLIWSGTILVWRQLSWMTEMEKSIRLYLWGVIYKVHSMFFSFLCDMHPISISSVLCTRHFNFSKLFLKVLPLILSRYCLYYPSTYLSNLVIYPLFLPTELALNDVFSLLSAWLWLRFVNCGNPLSEPYLDVLFIDRISLSLAASLVFISKASFYSYLIFCWRAYISLSFSYWILAGSISFKGGCWGGSTLNGYLALLWLFTTLFYFSCLTFTICSAF